MSVYSGFGGNDTVITVHSVDLGSNLVGSDLVDGGGRVALTDVGSSYKWDMVE